MFHCRSVRVFRMSKIVQLLHDNVPSSGNPDDHSDNGSGEDDAQCVGAKVVKKSSFWHCLAQNVDRLFFQDGGEMQREYDRLFKSLFASPDAYTAIIKVLAEHKRGLSRDEIALKCKMSSNGYLTRILSNLVNCDFIRSFRVKDKKIKANAQCYQLTDLFTLFHHTYQRFHIMAMNVELDVGIFLHKEQHRILEQRNKRKGRADVKTACLQVSDIVHPVYTYIRGM